MPVPLELPTLVTTQADEPVIGAIDFTVLAPSEDFVTWLERQPHTMRARTLIIRTPPERPVTELLQEAGAITQARYLALDTAAQAAIEDCDFGTVNRWLLESDIEALPQDLRAWIQADWVFEVQRLGAERTYVSARANTLIRHFDSLLAKVLSVFGGKRESPSMVPYLLDPNDGQRALRWEAIASALGPAPGPLLSNRPAVRPAPAEPIPFDNPAAAPLSEPASNPIGAEGEGETPRRWLKRTRAELRAAGWNISEDRYRRCEESAELYYGEAALNQAEIAGRKGVSCDAIKQDFYFMRMYGALDPV